MQKIITLIKQKIIKETLWAFATKAISFILFFALNIYLARKLGVELFGKWSYFYSLLSIVFILSYFGINVAAKKYIAQYNGTKELGNVIRDSVKIRFMFSLFVVLALLIISKPVAFVLGKPEFESLLIFAIPLVFLMGFIELFKELFIGLHRLKYSFIINNLEYGLKLLFIVLLPFLSIRNILVTYIFAVTIASVYGGVVLYKYFLFRIRCSYNNYIREIFSYSIPLFFTSIGLISATEIDTIMLGFLNGDEAVGIYAVAKQIIAKLPHISLAIAMGTMPVFAKFNKDNKEELKTLLYKLLTINAVIFSIIAFGIISLAWFFVPFFFGDKYSASVLPLQILTIYLIISSFSILLSTFLDYQGLAKKRAVNLSVCIVLNIILNFILIPDYGTVGAAIATSTSYVPYIYLNWIEVRRLLQ